eukprot:TRINITY_DN1132_c0_g1_i3.p1 TRINITY_DN1132_c0_g1~~TRINITY_DN1132_c0_g1_i3.p1  ORF type:complete len:290 (+),score=139.82 TRINITY_DN1132_c0_g1_i3:63-872(+)
MAQAGGAAGGAIWHACMEVAKMARQLYKCQKMDEVDAYQLVYAPPNKLTVSEAFVLLWQDEDTGDIDGRRSDLEVGAVALCANILDLILLGKLELQLYDEAGMLWGSSEKALVLVHDQEPLPPSCGHLQKMFKKICEYNAQEGKEPRTLSKWVEKLTMGWGSNPIEYIDEITDSLIEKRIIGKESKWNGYRFPTVDPSAEGALHAGLRKVIFDEEDPDMFNLSLIILAQQADSHKIFSRPFMYSIMTKDEHKKVKPRIDALKAMVKNAK